MRQNSSKIIVVLGPTAVGKSALGVRLAQKFAGEIISADSRQVYKGLDLGTGKVTEEEKRGVPHHLLDVVWPKEQLSVADWKERTEVTITDILAQNKLPIVVGGTGLYIQALVDNITPPAVPPNPQRRAELQRQSLEQLNDLLGRLDPERLATVERQNKRRLIRAIEIAETIGQVPKQSELKAEPRYNSLLLGLKLPTAELKEKIKQRLDERIKLGMPEEARALYTGGLSLERMEELGLEYRFLARYLKNELGLEEMKERIEIASWQYAKRQMTWFKRDSRIRWFTPEQIEAIDQEVKRFLDPDQVRSTER